MTAQTNPEAALGDEGRMSLMSHLIELRSRLIKAVIAVAVGAVIGWVIYQPVLTALTHPLRQLTAHNSTARQQLFHNGQLLVTDPLEGFAVRIKVSTYLGIMISMPVVLWQVWRFVSPGLYAKEKKWAVSFVVSATLLFAAGAGIALWTLPKALQWLQSVGGNNFVAAYSPQKYLMLIVYMMLAFGGGFEFPVLLIFLQLIGLVKVGQLSEFRRWGYVLIAVIAAVITPSTDPISMCALMIPMWIFYEVAIIFGKLRERSKRRAAARAA